MVIRQAVVSDIPQIIEMKQRGDFERYFKRIELTYQGQGQYLVIEDDGLVLGNVFLKYFGTPRDPDFPNIEDLFVREGFRDHGLGTKLVAECERLATEKGYQKIGLAVNPKLNTRAKNLYERLGFKLIAGRGLHLSGIKDGVEDWCSDMTKDL